MSDPRAENCRRFAVGADNKVTGVELHYLPAPATRLQLIRAELIDEAAAQGQIVASVHVLDANNLPLQAHCYMAWPWQGWQHPNRFENRLLPGNTNYPYQHMVTNAYNPTSGPGPMAIFIGDKDGNVLSDVIGGLGLPAGRHVCYHLLFRERSAEPEPEPEPEPVTGELAEAIAALAAGLARVEAKLDRLSQHLGAGA